MKTSNHFKKKLQIVSLKGLERSISQLLRQFTQLSTFSNLSPNLLRDLKLVLMEGISNAFRHGAGSAHHPVKISFEANPKKITMKISDQGRGFSLEKQLKKRPEDHVGGGRGLLIMKNLVDSVQYQPGKSNQLVLVRNLTRPKKIEAVQELFDLLQEEVRQLKPKSVLYNRFIDFIVDLFNVQRASFLIYDPKLKKLRVATSRGLSPKVASSLQITPGEGISGYVFNTSRPLLISQLKGLKKKIPNARPRHSYQTSSFVSIPVIVSPFQIGEETLGVLNLTDKRDGSRFTPSDLQILNLMATQAASLFRIRDLFETIQSQEGLKRELEIVHQIQDRLIPKTFPQIGDLEVFGKCKLSPRGGGDYLDLVKVKDRLRGVIADVSGHHVGSAITMSAFRSIFRSLVFDPNTPGFLLKVLRWGMHEDLLKLGQFISGWIFEYLPSGRLTVSGAGHPPLLHYRASLKKWDSIESWHLPLGLEDDSRPQNKKISLEKQDLLLMYTDGLFDPRMRETGFDKQRLLEWLEGHLHLSGEKLIEQLFAEVTPHHQALAHPDDIAVFILRRMRKRVSRRSRDG